MMPNLTPQSDRGRIVPPDLDDRTWQDLVDEMRALIPKYAPQWTDHNPSDLGIAMIELFAWLVEGLIYRLNRVPEKNYIAFLNLLGITRDPATPARVFLTFTAQPSKVTVARGTQAQTPGTETETPVVFETDEDVTVLPINLKAALLIDKDEANKFTYTNVSSSFAAPPASKRMVTIPMHETVWLCLGFDQPTTNEIELRFRLFRSPPPEAQPSIAWVYSKDTIEPSAWPAVSAFTDGTERFRQNGSVNLMPGTDWTSQQPTAPAGPPLPAWTTTKPKTPADAVTDALYWIGLRLTNEATIPLDIGIDRILFNAASAHNALTIQQPEAPDELGQSTGQPFQTFSLRHRPLFKRPGSDTPYDHLVVQVGQGTPPTWETWAMTDDLPAGAHTVYRVNAVTGEISFGNFDPTTGKGHGLIPPAGSQIRALTYRYVAGGASGNVGANRIASLRSPVPGIVGVANLGPSFDASDEEPLENTLLRAPEELKVRNRAVTAEDYEFLAREAATDVAIVRCLAPQRDDDTGAPWMFAKIDRSPGNITVIIIPDQGPEVPRPEPTGDLVREVQSYLDKRRDLTANLTVTGPRYLPIKVIVNVTVWGTAIQRDLVKSETDVAMDIERKLKRYLHPVRGGLDGRGWQIGQSVFIADLFKAIMPDENIGYITKLTLAAEPPGSRPFIQPQEEQWVRVADYELICYSPSSHVEPKRG